MGKTVEQSHIFKALRKKLLLRAIGCQLLVGFMGYSVCVGKSPKGRSETLS